MQIGEINRNSPVVKRIDLIYITIYVLLLVISLGYLTEKGNLLGWGFRQMPGPSEKSFVELYLMNYNLLPSKVAAEEKNSFSFTIVNRSTNANMFFYKVAAESQLGTSLLTDGKVDLGIGESTPIFVDYSLPTGFEKAKIKVELLNRDEMVNFTVKENQS